MSENLLPVTAETSSTEDDVSTSKSKKKKKAIGAFVVDAEPTNPTTSFWTRNKDPEKPVKGEAAVDKDKLEPAEAADAIRQLAAARRQELEHDPEFGELPVAEKVTTEAYLAAAESAGDLDAAYVAALAEAAAWPSTETATTEANIDTTMSGEGEIQLYSAAATGSGGTQPPRPPSSGEFGDFATGPAGPEPAPVTASSAEATVPLAAVLTRERQAQSEGLVVGAVAGYLIGRRRGRIKTEKRLAPVQKRLEKQVKALQTELIATEHQVRQKTRERSAPTVVAERFRGAYSLPPERIGHVIVAASSSRERGPAVGVSKLETSAAKVKAETMDRQELLALSQKVTVEGTSLRQIYETQLISEKGLRRLVAEHLRGGNIAAVLNRELIEHDTDFERDPIFRDKDHRADSKTGGQTALGALLAKAGVPTEPQPGLIGPQTPKLTNNAKITAKSKGQPSAVDISLVTLISVLALVIIALLFRG